MKTELTENRKFYIKRSLDISPNQRSFDLHAHEHYELLLFLSGDITYLVEGKHYHPKRGDILRGDIRGGGDSEIHKRAHCGEYNTRLCSRALFYKPNGALYDFQGSNRLKRARIYQSQAVDVGKRNAIRGRNTYVGVLQMRF